MKFRFCQRRGEAVEAVGAGVETEGIAEGDRFHSHIRDPFTCFSLYYCAVIAFCSLFLTRLSRTMRDSHRQAELCHVDQGPASNTRIEDGKAGRIRAGRVMSCRRFHKGIDLGLISYGKPYPILIAGMKGRPVFLKDRPARLRSVLLPRLQRKSLQV